MAGALRAPVPANRKCEGMPTVTVTVCTEVGEDSKVYRGTQLVLSTDWHMAMEFPEQFCVLLNGQDTNRDPLHPEKKEGEKKESASCKRGGWGPTLNFPVLIPLRN